jgi:hypothetical protein
MVLMALISSSTILYFRTRICAMIATSAYTTHVPCPPWLCGVPALAVCAPGDAARSSGGDTARLPGRATAAIGCLPCETARVRARRIAGSPFTDSLALFVRAELPAATGLEVAALHSEIFEAGAIY